MDWRQRQTEIEQLAERQLFFIGGAPRSGTTWLQQLLDGHPDISCKGEGLFDKLLATPIDTLMAQRRQALETKNTTLFAHTGGYPLPPQGDADFLIRTAILLALHRQAEGEVHHAIGEKTPENVFFFPRLKQFFPGAKFIGIARDPRDVLTSAWHFFHRPAADEDEIAAKIGFIHMALPSLESGARQMLTLAERYPDDVRIVTYENLLQAPDPVMTDLFAFLGAANHASVMHDCIAAASFATQTGGRPAGVEQNGSFLRKGVTGGWTSTLTGDMNAIILHRLGWMFPHFGWKA